MPKSCATVPDWTIGEKSLVRDFEFDTFRDAIDFINNVADLAEDLDHIRQSQYLQYRQAGTKHPQGGRDNEARFPACWKDR